MSTSFNIIREGAPCFACPVCGAPGKTRTSERLNPTISRLYYKCEDVICGHAWTAFLEYDTTLSPSSKGELRKRLPKQKKLFPAPARAIVHTKRYLAVVPADSPDT